LRSFAKPSPPEFAAAAAARALSNAVAYEGGPAGGSSFGLVGSFPGFGFFLVVVSLSSRASLSSRVASSPSLPRDAFVARAAAASFASIASSD
jgi:hypothetical protein